MPLAKQAFHGIEEIERQRRFQCNSEEKSENGSPEMNIMPNVIDIPSCFVRDVNALKRHI